MKKRNIIAVVVVLFICVAVYANLNMKNIGKDENPIEENFGESSFVVNDNAEIPKEPITDEKEENEKKDVEGDISEYFEKARLDKQKARDSAITTLKEAVDEENLSQATRDSAATSIEVISTGALSETRIETLVKAKGYDDCVALINESGVNVIVTAPEEGFLASDTTKIKDIAVSETDFLPSQIKIIEIN